MFDIETPVSDWKGNLVKEGNIIMSIRTKPMFVGTQKMGMMFTDKNGNHHIKQIWESEPYLEYCWEVLFEREVKMLDRGLHYYLPYDSESGVWMPIYSIRGSQPQDIVCIKGVSDNKEEYFAKIGVPPPISS